MSIRFHCINITIYDSVSSVDDSRVTLPPFANLTDKVLNNIIITEREIKDTIDTLGTKKASGPD